MRLIICMWDQDPLTITIGARSHTHSPVRATSCQIIWTSLCAIFVAEESGLEQIYARLQRGTRKLSVTNSWFHLIICNHGCRGTNLTTTYNKMIRIKAIRNRPWPSHLSWIDFHTYARHPLALLLLDLPTMPVAETWQVFWTSTSFKLLHTRP